MKINHLVLFVLSFFLGCTSYSQVTNSDRYIAGEHVYSFEKLDNTHENYYCEPQGAGRVIFYNHSEIISGFDARGVLKSHTDELKNYYFDAFHDPRAERANIKGQMWVISPSQVKIKCFPGKGGRSQIFPGSYG